MPFKIPGLEIITVLLLQLSVACHYLIGKILQIFNDLLKRIPILRTIYSAIGQLTETFAPKGRSQKSVVLVEYQEKVFGQ